VGCFPQLNVDEFRARKSEIVEIRLELDCVMNGYDRLRQPAGRPVERIALLGRDCAGGGNKEHRHRERYAPAGGSKATAIEAKVDHRTDLGAAYLASILARCSGQGMACFHSAASHLPCRRPIVAVAKCVSREDGLPSR